MSDYKSETWRVEPDEREWEGVTEIAGWNIISEGRTVVGCEGILGDQEADARLIAAAPDLLAVAKHAQEWTDPESVLGVRLAEAIARAEGK